MSNVRSLSADRAVIHCWNGSCRLVRTEKDQSSGGDSGGPVFVGNSAVGIHKGNNWWQWAYRDLYTRADLFHPGMGVHVDT